MSEARSGLQKMVQLRFPGLHEFPIRISRETGNELVACYTDARVTISNIRKTFIPIWGELNFQATGS